LYVPISLKAIVNLVITGPAKEVNVVMYKRTYQLGKQKGKTLKQEKFIMLI
jgi:hypothetical protein